MIVLDEQLQGRGIEDAIAAWYPGSVCFITDLRPGTVVKDDTVSVLLQHADQPTFITIDVGDFWQAVPLSEKFCVVCFALPDRRVEELPGLLQRLFRLTEFKTKAARRGKVVRISPSGASWYSLRDRIVQSLVGW